ncbi:signal peptide, CUB and EGF-like domain-containing protein 1 [Mercenaria mercenaria]|uniref:signal peptide, CUB and EGF-like domain-containing protein 1 n=1 Tax=Mercenaria mercenaria TaxID=6596 RepID=UPI00234E50B3|nr:signal peptide, CUB and EGF-like domain-containing protein 1 [Mercenaria mercenaria]
MPFDRFNGSDVALETITCPILNKKYGTIVTCIDKLSEYDMECNLTCEKGKVLTNGQRPYEKYKCGPKTGYIWEPTDKMPACVDAHVPDKLGTQVSVRYTDAVPDSDADNVISSVEQKFIGLKCDTCQLKSTIVSNNESKLSNSSTLTLQFSKQLTGNGDIALTDYLTNGTETAAMAELLDTFSSMNEIAEFIQTNSTSIFDVSVGGVEYTTDSSSISFAGTVTCADGYAGAGGLCAQCATGTKLKFPDCVSCEIGTYQPLEGQSECLPCPDGYTTSTFGASDISECAFIIQSYSSTVSTVTGKDDKNGNGEDDKTTVLVVALVVCVIVICTIAVVAFVFWKKQARRRFARNETAGSFISLSMVLPETRVTVENAKSSFNKELLVPAQAKSSYENTIYGTS